MGALYDEDILLWSERQADLLRRAAGGERVNDGALDWLNLSEEIEAMGRGELRACESLLIQAIVHRLKQLRWPDCPEVAHWRGEEIRFRQEASDAFSPSMRQRIDMERVRRRAMQRLPQLIDGMPPLSAPDLSGVALEEWLVTD